MKKVLSLLIALGLIISMTGCEKKETEEEKKTTETLTCTKTDTEEGMKTDSTIIVTHKDNKVLTVEQSDVSQMSEDMLEMSYSFGKEMAEQFNKVDGMEMTYEKVDSKTLKSTIKMDYTKLNAEALKEAFGSEFDESDFLKSKDLTVEEFKKEELDGYTCK